jgi:hypothetical protein
MMLLTEFSQEAVSSHALVVAQFMTGQQLSADIVRELGAEIIGVDKLTLMSARRVTSIQSAHECWQIAAVCFRECLDLWDQLHDDALVTGHRRLLGRLLNSALDRRQFYAVTEADRAIFNSGRDHGLPLTHVDA